MLSILENVLKKMSSNPSYMATASISPDPLYDGFLYVWNFVGELFGMPSSHVFLEGLLVIWIIRLVFFKSYKIKREELTKEEEEALIQEWEPEPLIKTDERALKELDHQAKYTIDSALGKNTIVNGKKCLNVGSMNFLNMTDKEDIKNVAVETISQYGVGSCGPRGFYGTVDVHLKFEEECSRFLGTEETLLYAYHFSTVASAIPPYSKRSDVIFADEACNFAIQKGIEASRSTVFWFKHNDMDHLEKLLMEQAKKDKKDPKKASLRRKFILVEGLYMNTGDLCPLKEIIRLKYEYKVRVFLDESYSIGTIGSTGRGVTEHFGVDMFDIDQIMGSLENALGSTGGFVSGHHFVVDHQRLSGQGYCYSASLPPFLCAAASASLQKLSDDPSLVTNLQSLSQMLHAKLTEQLSYLKILPSCIPESPIKHVILNPEQWSPKITASRELSTDVLHGIVDLAFDSDSVLFTVAAYLVNDEHACPIPSIRISVNCELTPEEVDLVCGALCKAELMMSKR